MRPSVRPCVMVVYKICSTSLRKVIRCSLGLDRFSWGELGLVGYSRSKIILTVKLDQKGPKKGLSQICFTSYVNGTK